MSTLWANAINFLRPYSTVVVYKTSAEACGLREITSAEVVVTYYAVAVIYGRKMFIAFAYYANQMLWQHRQIVFLTKLLKKNLSLKRELVGAGIHKKS